MDFEPFQGRADDGAVLTVLHPITREPLDAKITLAGADSKAWRKAGWDLNKSVMHGANTQEDVMHRAIRNIDENKADLLGSVTLSWTGVENNGKALECTRENARKLYEDHPWLLEQVDAFVGNRANFFRPVDAPAS